MNTTPTKNTTHINPQSAAMTFLLAAMAAIGPSTMDIYLASLPHIGRALDASAFQVQLTLSLYLVGFAISQIFYGPLSDMFGRRPMLLLGFGIYLIATACCAAASSIEMLIVARIFQALGAAGPIIIARAMVRDLHSGAEAARQLGLMNAILGIAPICAPVLGGALQAAFGWRSSFVLLEIFGAILFAVALAMLPETNRNRHHASVTPRQIAAGLIIVSSNSGYRAYVLINALSFSAYFAFLSAAPYVLQRLFHFGPAQFGATYALCTIVYIAGNAWGARLVRRLDLEGMLRLGSTLVVIAAVAQICAYALWPQYYFSIILTEMLLLLGLAFMAPQLMAAGMLPFPDRAGAASSMLGFAQMIAASLTVLLVGSMLDMTAWPMIAVSAVYCFSLFALLRLTHERRATSQALPQEV